MRIIQVLAVCLLLQGCISANYVKPKTSIDEKEGSILVMGFNAGDVPLISLLDGGFSPTINLAKVSIENGVTTGSSLIWVVYSAKIIEDYVVIQLPEIEEDEAFVLLSYQGNPLSNAIHFYCKGDEMDVFHTKKGDVLYIGDYSFKDFDYDYIKLSWTLKKTYKQKEMENYLSKTYPELLSSLKAYEPTLAVVNTGGS
ncbi:hypothetical protein L4D06_02990 [Enterovibrio makurazakiensis]|uniref:hypothetical protein n=1 Tax=Enterovibrio makurazakiensis TaxID=2910232 RepID=UPI003D1B0724